MKKHCTALLILVITLACALSAQMGIAQPVSIADLTGNSAAQQLSATAINARWVLVVALAANSSAVRVGDSNTGASRGVEVAAGGGLFFPPLPQNQNAQNANTYDLSKIYFYGTSSEKVSVIYGR